MGGPDSARSCGVNNHCKGMHVAAIIYVRILYGQSSVRGFYTVKANSLQQWAKNTRDEEPTEDAAADAMALSFTKTWWWWLLPRSKLLVLRTDITSMACFQASFSTLHFIIITRSHSVPLFLLTLWIKDKVKLLYEPKLMHSTAAVSNNIVSHLR